MPLPSSMPDLVMLELLVGVAETGSLGRAAARNGISQPAASMRVSALERRLRLNLVERGPTGSRLTDAGSAVVDWARPVLQAARELLSGAEALRATAGGRLRLAASMTIADHLIPAWLVALHRTAPEQSVALRVGNSTQVADLVRSREVDLGFVEGPRPPRDLRCRVVGGDELVVVVGPAHPWARRRLPVTPEQLAASALVTRESGSGTRDAADEFLAGAGPAAPPAAELGSATAIKAAVAAGDSPAVISGLAVATELADGSLIRIPVAAPAPWLRRFHAVWIAEHPPTGPAAALLVLIQRSRARAADAGAR